jgi:hypothetical protein
LDVALYQNYGYVAAQNRLHVLDLSDPENPSLVKTLTPSGNSDDVEVSEGVLYVSGTPGLLAFDLADPADPVQIGSYRTSVSGSVSVMLRDHFAFTSQRSGGLVVLDITNPAAMELAGQFVDSDSLDKSESTGVALLDDLALFSTHRKLSDLQVVQIQPATPTKISELGLGLYSAPYIVADGSHLFAGKYGVDAQDPANPVITSTNSVFAFALALSGNRGVLLTPTELQVYDVDSSGQFLLRGSTTAQTSQTGPIFLDLYGELALAVDNNRLDIFDISQPEAPFLRTNYVASGSVRGLSIDDGKIAIIADGSPTFLDLSDPDAPKVLGQVTTISDATAILVSDSRLYLADSSNNFQIYDISNLAAPALFGGTGTRKKAAKIVAMNGFAYLGEASNGLEIFDVRNPASPTRAGGSSFPISDFTSDGYHLFTGGSRFAVLDLFQPSVFRLGQPAFMPPGEIRLVIQGASGRQIAIERSDNLSEWQFWQNVSVNNDSFGILDTPTSEMRFYRAKVAE